MENIYEKNKKAANFDVLEHRPSLLQAVECIADLAWPHTIADATDTEEQAPTSTKPSKGGAGVEVAAARPKTSCKVKHIEISSAARSRQLLKSQAFPLLSP